MTFAPCWAAVSTASSEWKSAATTAGIVTVEDHSVLGGLGGAVAEAVAEHNPTCVARVGIADAFSTRPGAHREQLIAAGVSPDHIVAAAEAVANGRPNNLARFMPTISYRGDS